jgi:hypothetical protein
VEGEIKMSERITWSMVLLVLGTGAVTLSTHAQEPAKARKPTAEGVIKQWAPRLKSATDYQQWDGSPERSPDVAACAFRVVGPTFEELWNHYAERCGLEARYEEKTILNTAGVGPNGSYVVLNRSSGDGKGDRGPSVFLLRTGAYTVTVTFMPDPGGKSISGSISAVVP